MTDDDSLEQANSAPPGGPAPQGTRLRVSGSQWGEDRPCASTLQKLFLLAASISSSPARNTRPLRSGAEARPGAAHRHLPGCGPAGVRLPRARWRDHANLGAVIVGGCVWVPPPCPGPGRWERPHLLGAPRPLAVTCKQSRMRWDPVTAQAQPVTLPAPSRGRPVFFQQFIECLLRSRCLAGAGLGAGDTAGTRHGELALTELTF